MAARTPDLHPQPHLPLGPLEAMMARHVPFEEWHGVDPGTGERRLSHDQLARLLGCAKTTAIWYRKQGLPLYTADRQAVQLGYHPANVWPEFWEVA